MKHIKCSKELMIQFLFEISESTYLKIMHMDAEDEPSPPRRALRKRWADLIYKIYQVDPLTCPKCATEMKIVAFITDPAVIRRILAHRKRKASQKRAPPEPALNLH